MGGLGFKDIESSNDALLGNLSWRIHENPDSLLAQVLKGKYFPDCSFMESTSKQGSSHGWVSILCGRNLLQEGMGYLIGNGDTVNVWSDAWLSTSEARTPIGPPPEKLVSLKVCDLLLQDSNEWDVPKIREVLPQYEDTIRLLNPSFLRPPDNKVWLGEKSGIYTSKSGYKLASPSCAPPSFNWMQNVWNVKTSKKLQHFLWRSLNDALPVGNLLSFRGISNVAPCKHCGALETIIHVLFSCPVAQQVWEMAPISMQELDPFASSLRLLLPCSLKAINLPPTGLTDSPLAPWILWNLWTA